MFPSRDLAEISTSLSSWLLSDSTVVAFSVSGLQDFAATPVSSEYDSQKEMLSQQAEFCIRGQASEMSPQAECEREPRKVGIISPTESEALQMKKTHDSRTFQKIIVIIVNSSYRYFKKIKEGHTKLALQRHPVQKKFF